MCLASVVYKNGYREEFHRLTTVRVSDLDLTLFDGGREPVIIPLEDVDSFDVRSEGSNVQSAGS